MIFEQARNVSLDAFTQLNANFRIIGRLTLVPFSDLSAGFIDRRSQIQGQYMDGGTA
jgi:hypothetical protein